MKLYHFFLLGSLLLGMVDCADAAIVSSGGIIQKSATYPIKPLTLSSLFLPDSVGRASLTTDSVSYTFNGTNSDTINYIQLCNTETTDTYCTTCGTPYTTITTGTAIPYNVTKHISPAAIASYLSSNGMAAGSYNIGMYVQSTGLTCSSGSAYCSTNQDSAGHKLCMQATYNGSTVTALSQSDAGATATTTLGTAAAPHALTAVGAYYGLFPLAVTTNGGSTWTVLKNGAGNYTFNAVSCTSDGSVCAAAGVNNTTNTPILYTSVNGGVSWAPVTTIITTAATLKAVSCTGSGSSAVCVAVGQDTTNTPNVPLLELGSYNGSSWSWESVSTLTSYKGIYYGATCTGSASNIVCTVAGQNTGTTSPLLYVGINSSGSFVWTAPSLPSLPSSGLFNAASCTGSGANSLCIAAGSGSVNAAAPNQPPILYVSTDGGSTWTKSTTTTINGSFTAASCSPNGIVCTVAGIIKSVTAVYYPLIYYSTDSGSSWTAASTSQITQVKGILNAASCTDDGTTGTCVAAGTNGTNASPIAPLLYVSTNSGSSWSAGTTTTTYGVFYGANCTGSGADLVCAVAGKNTGSTYQSPFLYYARGSGVTSAWTAGAVAGTGLFNAINCTGSGTSANCAAVGAFNQVPLLSVSPNGGGTWATVPTTTDTGLFNSNSTSCSGSGATAVCIAAGKNNTTRKPFAYVSTDNGVTWSAAALPSGSNANSSINAASCAGDATNGAVCVVAGQDGSSSSPLLNVGIYTVTGGAGAWSWSIPSTPAATASGQFTSVSCSTGAAPYNTAICLASGYDGQNYPVMYVSKDGGVNWLTTWLSNNTNYVIKFQTNSCTGGIKSDGTGNAVCVAAGIDYATVTAQRAVFYQSIDGIGGSGGDQNGWTLGTSLAVSSGSTVTASSCSSSGIVSGGTDAVCAIAGYVGSGTSANILLYYLANPNGSVWAWNSYADTSISASLSAVSCTGSGSTAVCSATGVDTSNTRSLGYMTVDSGSHWSSISTYSGVTLYGTSCVASSTTSTICTAAGFIANSPPALYKSTNNGTSWSQVSNISSQGNFAAAGGS